jgi:hypothetical protein
MSLQSRSIEGLLSEVPTVMCVDVAGDQPTDRTSSTTCQSHLAGSQETWVRNGRWILLTKHLYSGQQCTLAISWSRVIQCKGRSMSQAVIRRPLTAEARVRSRVSPCGICGGQNGTGTGFPPSISFHRCSISRKNEKKITIFITGLHNKHQGCDASVASAAGPFTTKKKIQCNS